MNRKKQKRRQKAAAKAAAEAGVNGVPTNGASRPGASANHKSQQYYDPDQAEESDEDYQNESDSHHYHDYEGENGYANSPSGKSRKGKKKRKKGNTATSGGPSNHKSHPSQGSVAHGNSGISKERIWNTSSQEERERIKEFWLGLQEDERKGLVKVEKDAVLKKMKEQQKHTCSCTVCGRKRNAIEEELEGLYDAYYEELEQFAHHPHQEGHPPMMGASRHFGLHAPRGFPASYPGHQPSRGRIVEHVGDDEEDDIDDEEYSDEELEDDDFSDEEPEEEVQRDYASDFFNFGSSLTVQGTGIPDSICCF